MPHPLKNLGNEIIHFASSRDGLKPCYQAQQQLSAEIAAKPAPPVDSGTELNSLPTLETRLSALGLVQSDDAQHQQLHKEIASFSEMLGRSLNLHSAAVGKHYGVLDEHNRVIDNPSKLLHTRSGQFNRYSRRDPQLAGTQRHLLGNHKLSPVMRFGASLPLNLQRQSQNSMTFSLSDNELPQFLPQLTTNQLRPMDMLDKAIDHKVKNGNVWNLSLDIEASAQASIGLLMANKSETTNFTSARLGVGLSAGVNLLHGQRERNDAHNEEGSKVSHSDNRVCYLNQSNLDARLMVPVGVSSKAEHARVPIMATGALAVRYTFDGRTQKKINIELAEPQTLDHTHIDKIAESLGLAFTSSADGRKLSTVQGSAGDSSPQARLAELSEHFLSHLLGGKTLNNSQHAAIRDLQKLIHQREAMDNKVPLPGALEYQSTYNNLAKVDSNSLPHWIHDAFRFEMQDDNHANRIGAMMTQAPSLAGLIRQMQLSTDTKAEVTLELKDEARSRLVEKWLYGNIQLQDRSNMRIKSIAFVESKAKGDGITSRPFLIGGSSVSIEKVRKL